MSFSTTLDCKTEHCPSFNFDEFNLQLLVETVRTSSKSVKEAIKMIAGRPDSLVEFLMLLSQCNGSRDQKIEETLHALLADKECFWLLLQKYPVHFIEFIMQIENRVERQAIFQVIETKNPHWICESLVPLLSRIWLDHPRSDYFQYCFNQLIFDFTPHQLEDLANGSVKILSFEVMGFLLAQVKDIQFQRKLLEEMGKLAQTTPFKDYWLSIIESIFPRTTILQPHSQLFFSNLLNSLIANKRFKELVDHFFELSIENQINLLSVMKPREMIIILNKQHQGLAGWLGEVIANQQTLEARKQICMRFLKHLNSLQFPTFIHSLMPQRLEGQRGDAAYAFVPYLLLSFSETYLGTFLFEIDINVRSQLLAKVPLEPLTLDILQALKPYSTLLLQMSFEIHSNALATPSTTMEQCLTLVREIVKVKKDLDQFPDYEEFLGLIPAMLIGLVAQESVERALFFQVARYLTDKQLAFLVRSIPEEEVFFQVEEMASDLRTDQLGTIQKALSPSQLACYTEKKMACIQQDWQNFNERLSQMIASLILLECTSLSISRKVFSELMLEASTLSRYATWTIKTKYGDLIQYLQDLNDPSAHVLHDNFNQFKLSQAQFLGPFSIFNRLKRLEARLEPEEDIEQLPAGFLSLLTSGQLVHLGIKHAGELSNLGIRTEKDLEFLAISPDRQIQLEHLMMAINQMAKADGEGQVQLDRLWTKILALPVVSHSQEFNGLLNQLIQLIGLEKLSTVDLQQRGIELCKQLFALKGLSSSYQAKFKSYQENFCVNHDVHNTMIHLMTSAVLSIKARQPLMALKKYLEQTLLQQAWAILHERGYDTIEALVASGHLKKAIEIRALFEVANSIK